MAIPAKDEEERLPACLAALAQQTDRTGALLPRGTFGVVLLLNNCRDASAHLARSAALGFPQPMRIVECELPAALAHAGTARRMAMDEAAAWLEEAAQGTLQGALQGTLQGGHQERLDGAEASRLGEGQREAAWPAEPGAPRLILTTDADSRVDPFWLIDNLDAAGAGADAVAGGIRLDALESALLPDALHRRGRLEADYEAQLVEIAARLDPQPHNPWPHHATASGASLAVTLPAYRMIGGIPAPPLGEDKALVELLRAHDARVRFSPDIRVTTSGRLFGRAPGGAADTMRLRSEDPGAPCDLALEPLQVAVRRAGWRGRLRRLHGLGALHETSRWVDALGLSPEQAREAIAPPRFGAAWAGIEAVSPVLQRRPLTIGELPHEIGRAARVLERLRRLAIPADPALGRFGAPALLRLAPAPTGLTDERPHAGPRAMLASTAAPQAVSPGAGLPGSGSSDSTLPEQVEPVAISALLPDQAGEAGGLTHHELGGLVA